MYYIWLFATLLAVACAWWSFVFLKKRDAFQRSLQNIHEAPLETDDFSTQSQLLCQACIDEVAASGCTLYLQPGHEESGFRRAAQAGTPAEETGPGLVKDLLNQAWDSGQLAESSSGGRWILAFPVWPGHSGGGAMVVTWETTKRPGEVERSLLRSGAVIASIMAPRFAREGALSKAHEEIQVLKGEMAEESHLAGVGRLATGVAHELSTPLTAVLTMVGSLARTIHDPVGARRLQIIQDAVEKCKGIIEKLLVYSKAPLETEENVTFSRFVRASTDINGVIENSLELVRDNFTEHSIAVSTDLDEVPEIRANSTQWSQAFANLLSFSRDTLLADRIKAPQIIIRTRDAQQFIRVEFFNNGAGIPTEDLPRLFEPFYANNGAGLGSGLGLTFVRDVVRKHHGTIEAKSKAGEGTTFVIKIPLEDLEQKA